MVNAHPPLGINLGMWSLGVLGSQPAPVILTRTDHAEDNTAQTTYTWSSKAFAIGAAGPSRRVVVGIAARALSVSPLSSVTIGGVTATRITSECVPQNIAPDGTTVEFWQAPIPTGTTATVSATFAAVQARAGCAVFSVLNAGSVNSIGADSNGSPIATPNVFVARGGAAIILSNCSATTTGTLTPTNWTLDLQVNIQSNSAYGWGTDSTPGTRAYGASWAGGTGVALPTPTIAIAFAPARYGAEKPVNFTTTTGGATGVGATQGFAASTNYFFTSGNSTVASTQTKIATYANPGWGAALFTHDAAGDTANSIQQCNGMYVDNAANKLYVGVSNYPTTPAKAWIYEYTINSDGSLTFVAAHDVTEGAGCWTEGCAAHNGSFWVIFTDRYEIHQYDTSWNFVAKWSLPGTSPPGDTVFFFQSISWRGNTAYINLHGQGTGNASWAPGIDAFTWNGSGFTLCATGIRPPTRDCAQSIWFDLDGVSCWFAERVGDDITQAANVVKATIVAIA